MEKYLFGYKRNPIIMKILMLVQAKVVGYKQQGTRRYNFRDKTEYFKTKFKKNYIYIFHIFYHLTMTIYVLFPIFYHFEMSKYYFMKKVVGRLQDMNFFLNGAVLTKSLETTAL